MIKGTKLIRTMHIPSRLDLSPLSEPEFGVILKLGGGRKYTWRPSEPDARTWALIDASDQIVGLLTRSEPVRTMPRTEAEGWMTIEPEHQPLVAALGWFAILPHPLLTSVAGFVFNSSDSIPDVFGRR